MVGRKKCGAFQHLKDRIKIRIDNWSTHLLSQGGKEVFIKAILQAIPTYTMSCFLLPMSTCYEMEQLMANFWWQKGKGKRRIHWCPWHNLCELKEEGGLRSELGNSPSYTWKSIWAAKGLLLSSLSWRVGDGSSIKIEEDAWVPNTNGLLIQKTGNRQDVTKVSELIEHRNKTWLIRTTFAEEVVQQILLIPLARSPYEDFLCWRGEASGEYTENRDHIFRDCAVTKETWAELEFAWPQNILQSEYMEWNKWVHESQKRSGAETANFIKKYLQELKDIERKELTSDRNSKSWRPPLQGFFKINFDAAFNTKEKKSCSGVIVRNPKGVVTATKEQIHTNISSSFAAEAIACLQAVTVGRELGLTHVIIEGDSLTFQHVKRTENAEAHNLASEGLKVDRNTEANHGHATTSLIEAGNDTSKNGQAVTKAEVDWGWQRHL
ncbi:hypothetical protein CXB51_006817 [Gossypium anomalum]|uniref:RNase H type-1 domain-containing protein n=1 Tax=Gossypium anomalum TaxID=47600 RepID=A0A8J6D921_9ROSI|nr:hypothetical protein CXB51_006817 [Gossypium anomalum]